MEKLKFENVTYENYDLDYCLEIEELIIPKGSFFGLFGEDVEIKLDILKLCTGMKQPLKGNVELRISDDFLKNERFRFVPEEIIYETNMTGIDYFEFCEKRSARYGKKIEKALCYKIFQGKWDQKLLEMTYKENKLVSILAAISARPDVLFLDRPETYLDREAIYELYKTLSQFAKKGMTVVISTTNYDEIMSFCTDYAFLENGKILRTGKQMNKKEIPKIVTIIKAENDIIESNFISKIYDKNQKKIFIYDSSDMEMLNKLIELSKCEDFYVEQMPFDKWVKNEMEIWEG